MHYCQLRFSSHARYKTKNIDFKRNIALIKEIYACNKEVYVIREKIKDELKSNSELASVIDKIRYSKYWLDFRLKNYFSLFRSYQVQAMAENDNDGIEYWKQRFCL